MTDAFCKEKPYTELYAAFDAAARSTRMRTKAVNVARMVMLENATVRDAMRAAGIAHRQEAYRAIDRIRRAMLLLSKQGEKKRCTACGAVIGSKARKTQRGNDAGKRAAAGVTGSESKGLLQTHRRAGGGDKQPR